jgi:hypothetical protein
MPILSINQKQDPIRSKEETLKIWKYSLWTATIFVVVWVISLISCIVGGKGIDKMRRGV